MARNHFGLVFVMMLAAIFLIVTGLLGYEPPPHLSLDPATWRRGTLTGHIEWRQIWLGVVFLLASGLVSLRINRGLVRRQNGRA